MTQSVFESTAVPSTPGAVAEQDGGALANSLSSAANPYVGPRSFQTGETIYGRDREASELFDLLIAERIVLLHSPSGAGKSSLLNAKLLPLLRDEGFEVLPVMRVSGEKQASGATTNQYVLNALSSLEASLPDAERLPEAELATLSFADYLDRRPPSPLSPPSKRTQVARARYEMLIFDQFEEILTQNPTDQYAKHEFFKQVGAALQNRQRQKEDGEESQPRDESQNRHRWALFVVREDYLGALEPYIGAIPTRLSNTYRLDLLRKEAARQAIQGPAEASGVTFSDDVANLLMENLSRVQVQDLDGQMKTVSGLYVEPVQLQVVCHRLWQNLPPGTNEITPEHIGEVGDVDLALAGYYAEEVQRVAEHSGLAERAIREWFNDKLITPQGIRGQVTDPPDDTREHITDEAERAALSELVDSHLVRGESRRGVTWYELAHDRLVQPVRDDNVKWFEEHLSASQRQAMLWESQGRENRLLLDAREWKEAQSWAAEHPQEVTPVEKEFMAASHREVAVKEAELRRQEEDRQRDKRTATTFKRLAVALAGVVVIAGLAAFMAWQQAKVSQSRELAAASLQHPDTDLGVLLAMEAAKVSPTEEAIYALRQSLSYGRNVWNEKKQGVTKTFLSPSGELVLAVNNKERDARIYRTDSAKLEATLAGLKSQVQAAKFSPDGKLLAVWTGSEDIVGSRLPGSVLVYRMDSSDKTPVTLPGFKGHVKDVDFSPDSEVIAVTIAVTTRTDMLPAKSVLVYHADSMDKTPATLGSFYGESHIDFSLDSKLMVVSEGDDAKKIYRMDSSDKTPFTFAGLTGAVNFSPDDKLMVVTANGDNVVYHTDGTDKTPITFADLNGQASIVEFSPDGKLMVIVTNDGNTKNMQVYHTDSAKLEATLASLTENETVQSVNFSPDSELIVAFIDERVLVYHADGTNKTPVTLPDIKGQAYDVDFSPDSKLMAVSTGSDGTTGSVQVYHTDGSDKPPIPLPDLKGRVQSVTFSPDSKLLDSKFIVVITDEHVLIYHANRSDKTPFTLAGLAGLRELEASATFIPDSKLMAVSTTGESPAVRVYSLTILDDSVTDLLAEATQTVKGKTLTPQEREIYLHETSR